VSGYYSPADMAEAAQLEAHREQDMPRRYRLDVDREIAQENIAIGHIERLIVEHTCAYCPATADLTCQACDEWVCVDDHIDGVCPDCLGLKHRREYQGRT
jgi:hypothetical protein